MHPPNDQLECLEFPPGMKRRLAYPLDEAAELLGLSHHTLRRMTDEGQIAYSQTKKRSNRLIEVAELRRWLTDNRVERKDVTS